MKVSAAATAIVVGAALTGGSAALVWAGARYIDELRGPVSVTATGADVAPALVPLAAAGIAALGAILASRGTFRRLVGGLVVLLGGAVGWLGIRGLLNHSIESISAASAAAADSSVELHPVGPVLAIIGGLFLLVAGMPAIAGRLAARDLSGRYERRAAPTAAADSTADPALAMWKEMDEHRDPTLEINGPTPHDSLNKPPGSDGPNGKWAS
jgi:uncharacterized membrane protein (TIGR02234 family)